ncbi:MAG TPA: M2 family metallopeptidase [Candidatus Polarisedimenticolaceae bacterium]|nr:M2 family metallopeptidase [Candidatus Polarisedimenticolaceae bacterium]
MRPYRLQRSIWLPVAFASVTLLSSAGCAPADHDPPDYPATAEGAARFVGDAEARLLDRWIAAERASWVQENFITVDTERIAADAAQERIATTVELALASTRFDGVALPDELSRKIRMLKTSLPLVGPPDAALQAELAAIAASLSSIYGKGRYCPDGDGADCLDLGQLSRTLASSRDPARLLEAWSGWRTISPPMRDKYVRFVSLANAGATALGFDDLGALWRSGYDMPPERFADEVERLWGQVRPLYDALHCHVRARLSDYYGEQVVPPGQPIPAHLLGNMWAQDWSNVYDLVGPAGGDAGVDLTELLVAAEVDPVGMVRIAERFFTSLGFEPLPASFWERSLFTQPAERDVVCHASAWNIDWVDDLRIKMCIDVTAEDFITVHHELGHNFYQRAYGGLDPLYRNSANDGFHEGIGDTIALSITPEYLAQLGLLDREPGSAGDLGLLMRTALDKIAFLPFGYLVDQWRWKVFSGEIPAERYNATWWELRERYQGIASPVPRSEADFDPGAKYHVPANTPYTRYFLAYILEFQFHRALCAISGHDGPLHRCSIYADGEAGRRLIEMLRMGASRPWPDALEALTGQREMDATAILDYFAPLIAWLDEQNRERSCGW